MRNRIGHLAVILAALALLSACDSEPPAAPTVIVTPTQTVIITQPGGVSGTPTPAPGTSRFVSLRVGAFAQSCPGGGGVPSNASNTIRVGCIATFTATPKDASGKDLNLPDSAWAAMGVSWTVTGSACKDLDADIGGNSTNQFNRQVRGEAVGTCAVCAVVDGIGACAVAPNGERVVTVVS